MKGHNQLSRLETNAPPDAVQAPAVAGAGNNSEDTRTIPHRLRGSRPRSAEALAGGSVAEIVDFLRHTRTLPAEMRNAYGK